MVHAVPLKNNSSEAVIRRDKRPHYSLKAHGVPARVIGGFVPLRSALKLSRTTRRASRIIIRTINGVREALD